QSTLTPRWSPHSHGIGALRSRSSAYVGRFRGATAQRELSGIDIGMRSSCTKHCVGDSPASTNASSTPKTRRLRELRYGRGADHSSWSSSQFTFGSHSLTSGSIRNRSRLVGAYFDGSGTLNATLSRKSTASFSCPDALEMHFLTGSQTQGVSPPQSSSTSWRRSIPLIRCPGPWG